MSDLDPAGKRVKVGKEAETAAGSAPPVAPEAAAATPAGRRRQRPLSPGTQARRSPLPPPAAAAAAATAPATTAGRRRRRTASPDRSPSPPPAAAAAATTTTTRDAAPADGGSKRARSPKQQQQQQQQEGQATTAQPAPAGADAAAKVSTAAPSQALPKVAAAPTPLPEIKAGMVTQAATYSTAASAGRQAADQTQQQQQQPSPQQPQRKQQQPQPQQQQPQPQHQKQQQPQQQQQQQKQQQGGKRKDKKDGQGAYQLVAKFHQCVKREMPQAALHVYHKIKQQQQRQPGLRVDPGSLCSSLLNVAVGNWQWEMHTRHQHLVRSYEAQGRDSTPLQQAFDGYLAAERARLAALQEREQAQKQQQQAQQQQQQRQGKVDDDARVEAAPEEELEGLGGELPELPAGLLCHIVRHQTDKLILPDDLHNPQGLEDVLCDMPAEALPPSQLLSKVSALVTSDLAAAGLQPDETVLCQLARVAAIAGDPDKAFDYGRQVVAAAQQGHKAPPRLRDFHPALVGYAVSGQAGKAGEVIQAMLQHCEPGDLTESEYALWLEAIANGGTYTQLQDCLAQMAGDINQLRSSTLALVQAFFESERAAAALAAGGPLADFGASSWQQQWVVPDATGRVAEADVTLELQDLSAADWAAFDAQVFQKGKGAEAKPGQFETFRRWLDQHGPFDIIIDGANVAWWGENYDGGGFKPGKIRTAYETMQRLVPKGAKILLILHERRYHESWEAGADVGAWMEALCGRHRMYRTPARMNDDLFWLYATIHSRERGRLVSSDLMRDHIWSLLRPKHMLKWKQRHVVRYHFNYPKTVFTPLEPTPYTPCVQQRGRGVWLLPAASGGVGDHARWLLCRPQPPS